MNISSHINLKYFIFNIISMLIKKGNLLDLYLKGEFDIIVNSQLFSYSIHFI